MQKMVAVSWPTPLICCAPVIFLRSARRECDNFEPQSFFQVQNLVVRPPGGLHVTLSEHKQKPSGSGLSLICSYLCRCNDSPGGKPAQSRSVSRVPVAEPWGQCSWVSARCIERSCPTHKTTQFHPGVWCGSGLQLPPQYRAGRRLGCELSQPGNEHLHRLRRSALYLADGRREPVRTCPRRSQQA